jgi:DivIVA domain-containing protein
MMWLFAVLVVLVMGGVAALAAGRGAPMSEAYDDRPDALVPKDGPLRAEDVRRVRFSLAFRGYRMSEVDALLDRVARQLEPVEEAPRAVHDGSVADPDTAGQGDVADTPAVREVRGDDPVT